MSLNTKRAVNRCLDTGYIPATLGKKSQNDVKDLFTLPSDRLFV